MPENDEMLEEIMKRTFKEGEKIRLPCAEALRLAGRYGISPRKIGELCNERGIRISRCQLGCFQ